MKKTPRENGWKYKAINVTPIDFDYLNMKLEAIKRYYKEIEHPLYNCAYIEAMNTNNPYYKKQIAIKDKDLIMYLIDKEYKKTL
tara:strand:- start:858 stop:1109 length:252 start_codon:yes stop_codon:yes gene_type:complete